MSSDTDTRVIASRYYGTPTGTIASSYAASSSLTLPTQDYDTSGSFNGTTYTVPVSGKYKILGQLLIAATYTAGQFAGVGIYVNGTLKSAVEAFDGATGNPLTASINEEINCNAGDLITFRAICSGSSPSFNAGVAGGNYVNRIAIERTSGPAVIAATESVNLSVNNSASAASTTTPFVFATVARDSHKAYNASTGRWTAPVSGFYCISAAVYTGASANALLIYVNGSAVSEGSNNVASTNPGLVCDQIPLNAGDIVDIRPSSSVTSSGGSTITRFSISRLGN